MLSPVISEVQVHITPAYSKDQNLPIKTLSMLDMTNSNSNTISKTITQNFMEPNIVEIFDERGIIDNRSSSKRLRPKLTENVVI